MELADMQDLGSCAERRVGSSPTIRMIPTVGNGVFLQVSYSSEDHLRDSSRFCGNGLFVMPLAACLEV